MTASNWLENQFLEALRGTPFSVANLYVKLYINNPGEDGTNASSAAGNTVRRPVTFSAAAGGVMVSNVSVDWTSVSTSETYSHFAIWDNDTAGNCVGYAALTAPKSITAGDDATFPAGLLTWTID